MVEFRDRKPVQCGTTRCTRAQVARAIGSSACKPNALLGDRQRSPIEMQLPSRLYTLDIARGLAAAAVVFWHWQHFFFVGDALPEDFDHAQQPFYSWLHRLYDYGYLAVPFFFLLSGFVFFWLYHHQINERNCSFKEFAVLRLARLYPLHFVTLIVVLCLQWIYGRAVGGYMVYPNNDGYHFFLQTFFASNWGLQRGDSFNGPIWSVSIEIGLYCMFFVFALIKAPARTKLGWVLLIALVLNLFGYGGQWAPAAVAFFLGGATYELLCGYLTRRKPTIDRLIVIAAIFAWAGILVSDNVAYWLLIRGSVGVFLLYPLTVAALVVAETNSPDLGKKFRWIGDITYSSYLLHFPMQIACVLFAVSMGFDNTLFRSPAVLVAFFSLLILASVVTHHGFERPMQRLIRSKLSSRIA